MPTDRPRVAVFLGGPSSEHDVSLSTGQLVLSRMDRTRYAPAPVFVDREKRWHFAKLAYEGGDFRAAVDAGQVFDPAGSAALPWKPDVAFLGLHGIYGEDGQIQRELAAHGIPYTGSGPDASVLAMNKDASKAVFRREGLQTPADFPLLSGEGALAAAKRIAEASKGPWVVKPRDGGSSVGVEICKNGVDLARALANDPALGPFLVEQFVAGRELTCGVLENLAGGDAVALPPTEIRPKAAGFFDYRAKYTKGASEEITPAPISEEHTKRIQSMSLTAHRALGCRGYTRSDFILSTEGEVFLLETNTLPGLTETSLFPQAAAAVGIAYPEMLTRLVELALKGDRK